MEKSSGNGEDDENADDDLMVLVFKFICPMCNKRIRSTQQPCANGESSYFSLSNIERHLNIHAQGKKLKKTKDNKIILSKRETRKLRSNAALTGCDPRKELSCDEEECELLTDEESENEGAGDKIVTKRSRQN